MQYILFYEHVFVAAWLKWKLKNNAPFIYQQLGHYRLILRISFVRVPSRGFAKVPEQTIQKTEKQRRVWVGSGDIAECCSLMSKCHAEARQILCRSPNRSTHRQNGIYNKFKSLFCVLFDLFYKWNILYKIGKNPDILSKKRLLLQFWIMLHKLLLHFFLEFPFAIIMLNKFKMLWEQVRLKFNSTATFSLGIYIHIRDYSYYDLKTKLRSTLKLRF